MSHELHRGSPGEPASVGVIDVAPPVHSYAWGGSQCRVTGNLGKVDLWRRADTTGREDRPLSWWLGS